MGVVNVATTPGAPEQGRSTEFQCEGLGTHVAFAESVDIDSDTQLTGGVLTFTVVDRKRKTHKLHLAKDLYWKNHLGEQPLPKFSSWLTKKMDGSDTPIAGSLFISTCLCIFTLLYNPTFVIVPCSANVRVLLF